MILHEPSTSIYSMRVQVFTKEKGGKIKRHTIQEMTPKRESHGRYDLLLFILIGPKLLSIPFFYVLLNLL